MPHGPDPTAPLKVLPAGWITKVEALKRTGRSLKRFEQTVAAAGIAKRTLEVPHKRPTPIYKSKDIDTIVKRLTAPARALTVRKNQALAALTQLAIAGPAARAAVSIDRMHLVTMKQAHQLGYPWELLRAWKNSENPPGLRYGKTGFKFSVSALADRVRRLE